MKIFFMECTEDELRANRGIMDAIIDACQSVVNTFCGTTRGAEIGIDEEEQEDEE